VVGANWYRFRTGERIHNKHVNSVCFMWTRTGTGTVICNGTTFTATADTVIRMPWAHEVEYLADAAHPFHVGTVHVVPWLSHEDEFIARVGFREGDALLHAPGRTGGGVSTAIAEIPAQSDAGARIIDLAAYAVERFLAGRTEEAPLRALGQLLVDESERWDQVRSERSLPTALRLMIRYIAENLPSALTVRAVAAAGSVSTATAERLFTRHMGTSVLAWVRRRRMEEASVLLQSSSMSVREVAQAVGYPDAFYFSRVFTATFGIPPSRFADRVVRP